MKKYKAVFVIAGLLVTVICIVVPTVYLIQDQEEDQPEDDPVFAFSEDSPVLERFQVGEDKVLELKDKEEYKERRGEDGYSGIPGSEEDSVVSSFSRFLGRSSKDSLEVESAIEESFDYEESNSPQQAANLKGGEIDDNELFQQYLEYIQTANKGNGYDIDLSHRYLIKVEDLEGKGVLGHKLVMEDGMGQEYRIRTDTDGQIYFYPSSYIVPNNQVRGNNEYPGEYKIYYSDNRYVEFSELEDEWVIDLDYAVNNKSNLTLDLAFIIDTTGSMSDQINKLKDTIQSISNRVKSLSVQPKIRYGMVIYRDQQDEYLTRVYDFTEDLNEFQANLNKVRASGGGDYEEDVNTALADSLEELSWGKDKNTVRISFLVADAPPHMDYGQNYDYRTAMLRALELGVKIYPLASSGLDNSEGEYMFRQIALITNAKYVFITNAQGGTDYHVSENDYSVEKLDDLIVALISGELESVE
ncbi:VWA domain-containing protein [Candidatus Dojkabacteria bacterium]|nr:VWA domain-containing protein [Candidatus Dojkabacteria bacterium]